MEKSNYKFPIKYFRLSGRVISTIWAPFLTLFILLLIIMSQGPSKFMWDRDGFIVIILIFLLISVIIAWWHELIGGIALIAGVIALIPFGLYMYPKGDFKEMLNILLFFSPLLISGIFYLFYWFNARKINRKSFTT
jgi:hypothetical protein